MDPLERDQEFYRALYESDGYLATVTVIAETKGVIEADILRKLSTLNKKGGKLGAIIVILQPELQASAPDARGPEYFSVIRVQVIEDRLMNRTSAGTEITSWQLAERCRQLGHRRNFGFGPYAFAGMVPAPQAVTTRDSMVLTFRRLARDEEIPKLPAVLIDPEEGASPVVVTLTGFPGAAIWYSLDGSYPTLPYEAPLNVTVGSTLLVAQTLDGYAPSDLSAATFT